MTGTKQQGNKAAENKSRSGQKNRPGPGIIQEPSSPLASAWLPGWSAGIADSGLDKQAKKLGDRRLATIQRQALAASIGRLHGNRHLGQVVAMSRERDAGTGGVAVQLVPDVQRDPDPPTRADQEAEAAETMTRLRDTQREMLRHSNQTVRNTGQLFVGRHGQPPRLRFSPMTLRSDSASLVRTRGDDPATTAYYFFGLTQDNTEEFGPNTTGTVDGDTIIVRGKSSSGSWRSRERIMRTFVHEASHILVSAYGEHPRTDVSARSFDRYKDEFRAYFITPFGYTFSDYPPDRKARAIKEKLVGTSAADPNAYELLRDRYWSDAAFKRRVDAHRRPDGFNQSNNPRLDRLFQLLNGISGGTTMVEDVLSHIIRRMSPEERAEAARARLITRLTNSLGGDDTTRVRNALTYPRTGELARGLNPTNSPRVTAFLEAIAHEFSDEIKATYRAMTARERGRIFSNSAPMLVFIDRQVTIKDMRAATVAMIVSGRLDQFDAMINFLEACFDAYLESVVGSLTAMTPALQRTLDRLVYRSRLALYRLEEPVRREYVDVLPDPVKGRLLYALREEGEL